jgi:hypothetical protein
MTAMNNFVRFDKKKAEKRFARAKGKTLCKSGFHKWIIDVEKQFDSRQGRLVTLYRCQRCSAQKIKTL